MKKKPVKRKVLGGALMNKMTDGEISVPMGIIPQMLYNRRKDRKEAAAAASTPTPTPTPAMSGPMQRPQLQARGMKKGGKVRGDGICQRGKTKGTMR